MRFLEHCMANEQRMFVPQVLLDEELSSGLGWGLEIGENRSAWQWGNDPGYKNFAIGTPARRVGVVVFTNGNRGRRGVRRHRARAAAKTSPVP